jgi:hypothetical protein
MIDMIAETATKIDPSVVGGAIAYGLIMIFRAIAAVIPNETNNKWCKKLQSIVKVINVLIGLDMKAGVKKYGPK